MIKTTIIEFNKGDSPLFYSKETAECDPNRLITPIDGYTLNENVACTNCKYYKETKHHFGGGYSSTEEICNHKENVHYTYDHKGKHSHIIWSPKEKNQKLNCELYEKKVPIMQKIKIRLGIQ